MNHSRVASPRSGSERSPIACSIIAHHKSASGVSVLNSFFLKSLNLFHQNDLRRIVSAHRQRAASSYRKKFTCISVGVVVYQLNPEAGKPHAAAAHR